MEAVRNMMELDEIALVRLYPTGEVTMRVRVGDKLVDTTYKFDGAGWAHVETEKVT
jgi:hypothetical protein